MNRTETEVISERTWGEVAADTGWGAPQQPAHGNEEVRYTTIRLTKQKQVTRQGVRDLNGPRMNGSGYNGHKSATCAHHRAPDLTPKYTLIETIADEHGMPKDLRFDCCSLCNEKLGEVDR